MVPLHVDHNEKKSKMMWHIKLKETRCVPLSACLFVSFPGVVHREDTVQIHSQVVVDLPLAISPREMSAPDQRP